MTDMDRKVDAALDAYMDKFGEPYPLGWANSPGQQELVDQINTAIKSGRPVKEPQYIPDAVY